MPINIKKIAFLSTENIKNKIITPKHIFPEEKILAFRLKNKAIGLPNLINNFLYSLGTQIENPKNNKEFIKKYYKDADVFYKHINLSNEKNFIEKNYHKEISLIENIKKNLLNYKNNIFTEEKLNKNLVKCAKDYFDPSSKK